MPAILNTNMASLYAQKSLSTAQADLASSVQKLSSGKRINSAKDDAAGYAVAEAVKSTKNITDQSIQNTQDAISLVQTAEGALDVVGKMLQRLLTLATQKENGTLTTQQTASINNEMDTLLGEISKISDRTRFQGGSASLFSGSNISFTTGSGTNAPTTTTINIKELSVEKLVSSNSSGQTAITTVTATASTASAATNNVVGSTTATLTVAATSAALVAGASVLTTAGVDTGWRVRVEGEASGVTTVNLVAGKSTTLAIGATDTVNFGVGSSSSSAAVMTAVQNNIVNRAELGAVQNRLNYIVDNMQTLSNNLADAQSRIIDTDYAAETAKLTRGQILQQAATSMLAQANQMPNVILTLLK
jgi:flagellin